MLRTGSLTLFSILGCSTVFAQTKQTPPTPPFEMPGEIVSRPSNPRTDIGAIVPASYPPSATVSYPQGDQVKQSSVTGCCIPGQPAMRNHLGHGNATGDCLNRLSNWLFYRPPPWPKSCGLTPTPYHVPGYAYFYHPNAGETPFSGNYPQTGCSGCSGGVVQESTPKPEVKLSAKPELRPLIPNTSIALGQPVDPKIRAVAARPTSDDEDGEPYYYPRITAPSNKQSPSAYPNGATLPGSNR